MAGYPNTLENVFAQIEYDTNGGCWLWTGYTLPNGYGRFRFKGEVISAHRFMYRTFRGHLPSHMSVLHRCDVRCCVNPNHLFLGTKGENNTDRAHKGRSAHLNGETNHMAKLTTPEVLEIRRRLAKGETTLALGPEFNVSPNLISRIKRRIAWGWLPPEELTGPT